MKKMKWLLVVMFVMLGCGTGPQETAIISKTGMHVIKDAAGNTITPIVTVSGSTTTLVVGTLSANTVYTIEEVER